jgi:hypothetical protein
MQEPVYQDLDDQRKGVLSQLFDVSEPVESASLKQNSQLRLLTPKTGKMPIVLALEKENAELREEIIGLKNEIMALKYGI